MFECSDFLQLFSSSSCLLNCVVIRTDQSLTLENTFLRLIEFYVTCKCEESTSSLNWVVLQISKKHSVSHALTAPEKL